MEKRVLTSPASNAMDEQPSVSLYFDPVSPYVWLSLQALPRIEAAGARVVFEPVLFAAMLGAHGHKGPAEIAAKRAYTFRDVMRQAARQGLDFTGPPGHPFNPLAALRMCLALDEQPARRRFAIALVRACWERGDDISDPQVLVRLAHACDLDGDDLLAASRRDVIKQQLAHDTERAIADGVFGVPTFRLGDELFWGGDRVDALLWRLHGNRIDEEKLAAFLERPPLAQRKI